MKTLDELKHNYFHYFNNVDDKSLAEYVYEYMTCELRGCLLSLQVRN
jgi:hypothetical protein